MDTFKTLRPWFRLVRLPNLLTVPGDTVAGFLLGTLPAHHAVDRFTPVAAAGAALCLYIFGLILNDILDIETDRQERPERPLPSGQITVPQARMAAIVMALSGLNLALAAGRNALYVAAVLAALILAYNAVLKRLPIAGVVAMGLCRGLSLLMGAAAACPDLLTVYRPASLPVLIAVIGETAYVCAFSVIAKHEMESEKPGGAQRWMPFAVLLTFLPVLFIAAAAIREYDHFTPTVYVFLMAMTLMRAWFLGGILYRLQPVPDTVGGHIRNLLMVQACCCAVAGKSGLLAAAVFVLLSLLFRPLAARFYSS